MKPFDRNGVGWHEIPEIATEEYYTQYPLLHSIFHTALSVEAISGTVVQQVCVITRSMFLRLINLRICILQ